MTFSYQNYQISLATNQDILPIKNLIFKILAEYQLSVDENGIDSDLNNIETNYHKTHAGFWLIRNNKNMIVGTFAIAPHNKTEIEIRKVYFDKAIRGKGLGKYVMQFLIDKAREWQYKTITLETAKTMHEAIHLYQKLGFQLQPTAPNACRCDHVFRLTL